MENPIFSIPEHRMDEFKTKIEKLNKKAKKIGLPKIEIVVVKEHSVSYRENPFTGVELITPMVIHFFDIQVNGIEPKYEGWTFLARIDHEPGNINIINSIPGIELDERYRSMGNVCEHCRINRYRKASYVVRHADGNEKQVGSSCLKDFLGHGSPDAIAAYCESIFTFIKEIGEDEYRFGGRIEERFYLKNLLSVTHAVIRNFGWVSVSKASETDSNPTVNDVRLYFSNSDGKEARELREKCKVSDEDVDIAEKAIAWIAEQSDKGSDYIYNLKLICGQETVASKHIAIAISLVATYKRAVEKIALNAAKTTAEASSWIGHPDAGRMTLKGVKVIGCSITESMYGTVFIYRFLANGKDKLTWFASKDQFVDQGATVDITFTVKKLDVYKDEHVTVITRAKIKVVEAAHANAA